MAQQRMQVNGYHDPGYQGRGQGQINGEGEEEGEWEEEEEPRQASYAAEQRPRQSQQAPQQWQQQQWQRPGPPQGPLPRYSSLKPTPTPPSVYPRTPPPYYEQNQRAQPQPVRPNGYNNGGYHGGKKY